MSGLAGRSKRFWRDLPQGLTGLVEAISHDLGARRALLGHMIALNALCVAVSFIAFFWRQTFHEWLGAPDTHLPVRVSVFVLLVASYNFLFFTGRSLTAMTLTLTGTTLFYGAHDLLRSVEVGDAMNLHVVQTLVRLSGLCLLLRIWVDDYFAKRLMQQCDARPGDADFLQ